MYTSMQLKKAPLLFEYDLLYDWLFYHFRHKKSPHTVFLCCSEHLKRPYPFDSKIAHNNNHDNNNNIIITILLQYNTTY